jgi:hypothetical protein
MYLIILKKPRYKIKMNPVKFCLLILNPNYFFMNRKILLGATFVIMTWAFTSCEALNSCKICRQVTYINEQVSHEGPETEYCDAKLIAIESSKDVVSGNTRISWECR